MTKAVIIAGCPGEGMGELCEHTPKPLLRVGPRSIIDHTLSWLARQGLRDVMVSLREDATDRMPKSARIEKHVGDGSRYGLRVQTVRRPDDLGTAGVLPPLRDWLGEDPFVLLRGDGLYDFDLDRMLKGHAKSPAVATLALRRADPGERIPFDALRVEADRSGRILRFLEGEQDTAVRELDVGVAVLESSLLTHVATDRLQDLYRDLYPLVLRNNGILGAHRITGRALIVDTPESLARARGWFDGEIVGEALGTA
jgi:mannose-1-phosphate guanylyltransferase